MYVDFQLQESVVSHRILADCVVRLVGVTNIPGCASGISSWWNGLGLKSHLAGGTPFQNSPHRPGCSQSFLKGACYRFPTQPVITKDNVTIELTRFCIFRSQIRNCTHTV